LEQFSAQLADYLKQSKCSDQEVAYAIKTVANQTLTNLGMGQAEESKEPQP
jgi:hypothetical protein